MEFGWWHVLQMWGVTMWHALSGWVRVLPNECVEAPPKLGVLKESQRESRTAPTTKTIIAWDLGSCQPNTQTRSVEFRIRMFLKYEFAYFWSFFTGSQHFLLSCFKLILFLFKNPFVFVYVTWYAPLVWWVWAYLLDNLTLSQDDYLLSFDNWNE